MTETMLKGTGQTTDKMALGSGKGDMKNRGHRTERNTTACTGNFESKEWLNSARYI